MFFMLYCVLTTSIGQCTIRPDRNIGKVATLFPETSRAKNFLVDSQNAGFKFPNYKSIFNGSGRAGPAAADQLKVATVLLL
jgi:hypothetical protein